MHYPKYCALVVWYFFHVYNVLQRARHYKRTRDRSRQQKHKFYVSKEPAFCDKQQNTHFTIRRQTMLTLVSNSRNFCSASPSFRLSDCKHTAFFSICVENTLNTHLETKERNRSARRPMPLHKRTPQRQARRLQ